MGYVFNFNDAIAYEKWNCYQGNSFSADLESRLMLQMLKPVKGESILDIGCGTGLNLVHFLEKGIQVTGLDPSPYMLDIALQKVGSRADLYRGIAEDLPFEDNSFNYACLITSLEFVDNPEKALREAFRVAKDRVFLGVLNSYALKSIQRRVKGIFSETIYNRARFYSIWELKQLINRIIGDVPVSWRTVCQFPSSSGKLMQKIEKSKIVQRFPFGAFTGMLITLVPRFRARPLAITHRTKRSAGTVPSFNRLKP